MQLLSKHCIKLFASGGLGNQLFVWNMAHLLEEKYSRKVQVFYIEDCKSRADRPPMLFELSKFCGHNIEVQIRNDLRIPLRILDKAVHLNPSLGNQISRILGICDEAKGWRLDSPDAKVPRLVRGYFQSYSLVARAFDSYKTEFSRLFASVNDRSKTSRMREQGFQMAHIRRGDYVLAADHWGLLSFSYYVNLMDMSSLTYICSDDEEFCGQIQSRFPQAGVLKPSEFTEWQILELFQFQAVLSPLILHFLGGAAYWQMSSMVQKWYYHRRGIKEFLILVVHYILMRHESKNQFSSKG